MDNYPFLFRNLIFVSHFSSSNSDSCCCSDHFGKWNCFCNIFNCNCDTVDGYCQYTPNMSVFDDCQVEKERCLAGTTGNSTVLKEKLP